MIDIKYARENAQVVKASQKSRGESVELVDELLKADESRRDAIAKFESIRSEQNTFSKQVGAAKGDEKQQLLTKAKDLANEVKAADQLRAEAEQKYRDIALKISNIVDANAPVGGEADFKVLEEIGKPRDFAKEGFTPKDHVELGKILKAIDTERAAKVSGARFNVRS